MPRAPIVKRQIANEAVQRAYGGTGYETHTDDHPPMKSPIALGVRVANAFRKVTTGLVPGESDAHYAAVGQQAYYNAQTARNAPASAYSDVKSAVRKGRK